MKEFLAAMKSPLIPAQSVEDYKRRIASIHRYAEETAPEVFKWLGWGTAIAAVQVVAIRVESEWLKVLPFVLCFFIAGRIQWFFGLNHTELLQPDGSLRVRWRFRVLIFLILAWGITYLVAVKLAGQIAHSDLLPPVREEHIASSPQTLEMAPSVKSKSENPVRPESAGLSAQTHLAKPRGMPLPAAEGDQTHTAQQKKPQGTP